MHWRRGAMQDNTTVVLAILIVVFGVMTVIHAPTEVFLNIQMPVSSVVWLYDGLMPQETDGRVTRVFEQTLSQTVEGIKTIVSTSVRSACGKTSLCDCPHDPRLFGRRPGPQLFPAAGWRQVPVGCSLRRRPAA